MSDKICHIEANGSFLVTVDFHRPEKYRPLSDDETKEVAWRSNSQPNLLKALKEIASLESRCCPRCEGNGRLWADDKPHLPTEQVDTIPCGDCGGSGRIFPQEKAQEIAQDAIERSKKGD